MKVTIQNTKNISGLLMMVLDLTANKIIKIDGVKQLELTEAVEELSFNNPTLKALFTGLNFEVLAKQHPNGFCLSQRQSIIDTTPEGEAPNEELNYIAIKIV